MFNRNEIIYHLINSFIAGTLVFLGYFVGAGDTMSMKGIGASLAAAAIIFLNKFYTEYWANKKDVLNNRIKKKRLIHHLFSFI